MSAKDTGVAAHTAPQVEDPMTAPGEKVQDRPYAGDGFVPKDFREQDFMTRNGLNLNSFTRRKFYRSQLLHA